MGVFGLFGKKEKPAYMVVADGNGLDIGVVPAAMVDTIEKYADRDSSVEIVREYYIDEF